MRSVLPLLAVLSAFSLAPPSFAQAPGTCETGQAQRDLDVSGVSATLSNTGALFLDEAREGGAYEVPLGAGASPVYAAGLWVSGQVGGTLRMAGSRYDNFEFWPGPLTDDGTLPNSADCSAYDRIWVVSALDIAAFEQGNGVTDDLAAWPVELGAPVIAAPDNGFDDDGDGLVDEGTDGIDNDGDAFTDEHDEEELVVPEVRVTAGLSPYNLSAGDRPEVLGTQTAFWVMNDVGNVHTETGTPPIGLEVRVSAFAIGVDDGALYPATFYRYTLVKKSAGRLGNAYVSLFLDPDVGDSLDDYVGSDPTRGLAFAYNATETDAEYGVPPAVGFDLFRASVDADGDGTPDDLDRPSGVMYFNNVSGLPTSDPSDGAGYRNLMQGRWTDGTPLTTGGDGYQSAGPFAPFAFPGAPEAEAFWSEVNADGNGSDNAPGDRRLVVSVGPFEMERGVVHTLDVGLLFAQGSGNLGSVAELRAVSDEVQARYDDQTLFAPFDAPPPIALSIPALTAPADDASFVDADVTLEWTEVPGALRYRVERSATPDFQDPETFFAIEPGLTLTAEDFPTNEAVTYLWRVRAERYGSAGAYPPPRSFTYYRYAFDQFGFGTGVIEVANPAGEPCPVAGDPGCEQGYPGNTVWLSPNSTGDYVLTNPYNDFDELLRYPEIIEGDDFEMRFSEACANAGACLGIYSDAAPGSGQDEIASVPFELWNVGNDDTGDETRMIPILRASFSAEGPDDEPLLNWADAFPSTQGVAVGGDTLTLGVTHRVLWMMPDRPDGYARFAAAASAFGGPGGTYDRESDGDEQIDINPATGLECRTQDYYVDFCYRGASTRLVAPIGGLDGIVLADLAGDGTTPPVGTVIRFDANERLLAVSAEADGPAQPAGFALAPAYPNPFSSRATVPFEVAEPGRVRLSAFDVLGREVSVLVDGDLTAGEHRAVLDGSRLASGVYFVVLETGGVRQAKKVMLVR